MGRYSDSEVWEDVIPIPQDDGCANPLAAISYTERYSEAMSYLRAVMATNEQSDRVLGLIEDIIKMNPAHYTVWTYRARILIMLGKDLYQELEWLNKIALKHIKNFQIWHHRQVIMSHIPTIPTNEIDFLASMFAKDAKNYHVWSYRQWLVRHFELWDSELPYIETLLDEDVRNNSAWNYRWFIIYGRHTDPKNHSIKHRDSNSVMPQKIVEREIEYTKKAITKAPQNPSPWLYLRGTLQSNGRKFVELKAFVEQFASLDKVDEVTSSHALDFLAELYAQESEKEKTSKVLGLLADRYDPIRRNYWIWLNDHLASEEHSTAS